jgi:hypothetical protein
MLRGNDSLLRLDISYNWMTRAHMEECLGPRLKENHTLLDIFCEGSCAYVDAEGFLQTRPKTLTGVTDDSAAQRIAHGKEAFLLCFHFR